jgi:hypothetical protein
MMMIRKVLQEKQNYDEDTQPSLIHAAFWSRPDRHKFELSVSKQLRIWMHEVKHKCKMVIMYLTLTVLFIWAIRAVVRTTITSLGWTDASLIMALKLITTTLPWKIWSSNWEIVGHLQ